MTTDDARVAAVSAYEDAEPYKKLIEQLRSPHFGTVFGNEAADVIEALLSRKRVGGDDRVMARLRALSVGDEFTAGWVVDGCREISGKQVYNVLTYQTKIGVLERIAYGRYRLLVALSTETPPVAPAPVVTEPYDDWTPDILGAEIERLKDVRDATDRLIEDMINKRIAALAVPAQGVTLVDEIPQDQWDNWDKSNEEPTVRQHAPDAPKSELERLRIVANCYTDSVMRHSAYGFSASDPDGDYTYFDQAQSLLDAERAEREKAERELASARESREFWFNAAEQENARAETLKTKLAEAVKVARSTATALSVAIMLETDDPSRGERLNQIWRELSTFLQSQDKEADHVDPRQD